MSRIGRKPIAIQSGVDVKVEDQAVSVKGHLGQLSWTLAHGMNVEVKDGNMVVQRSGNSPSLRALHGLTRAELQNLVEGVTNGYERILELTGVGYRAQMDGQTLALNVGFAHPVTMAIPNDITVTVDKQAQITIRGIDKRQVTQVAANIRNVRPPDVYKQKGVRYAGEVLIKKAGKAGKK